MRIVAGAYRWWAKDLVYRAWGDYATRIGDRGQHWRAPDWRAEIDRPPRRAAAMAFVGWSWIVPAEIVEAMPCFCLHPSPLPFYAGGSPLQHQIINGETTSAVTIFRMTNQVDAGPIVAQAPISLEGSLADILARIVDVGAPMLRAVLMQHEAGTLVERPQDMALAPAPLKRRTPAESEINHVDWHDYPAAQIANKIRALAHPDYPGAFIQCGDGKKLVIDAAHVED